MSKDLSEEPADCNAEVLQNSLAIMQGTECDPKLEKTKGIIASEVNEAHHDEPEEDVSVHSEPAELPNDSMAGILVQDQQVSNRLFTHKPTDVTCCHSWTSIKFEVKDASAIQNVVQLTLDQGL